jgi:iron complex transport system substrate-binding protein
VCLFGWLKIKLLKKDFVMENDDITGCIIDTAMKIHRDLGPGLLESVYEILLAKKLEHKGFKVLCQQNINFEYDGIFFKDSFRLDLLIEDKVIVELKAVEKLLPVHSKQLYTYLRLLKLEIGLLINFNEDLLKDGISRIVNNHIPSTSSRLRVNQLLNKEKISLPLRNDLKMDLLNLKNK